VSSRTPGRNQNAKVIVRLIDATPTAPSRGAWKEDVFGRLIPGSTGRSLYLMKSTRIRRSPILGQTFFATMCFEGITGKRFKGLRPAAMRAYGVVTKGPALRRQLETSIEARSAYLGVSDVKRQCTDDSVPNKRNASLPPSILRTG